MPFTAKDLIEGRAKPVTVQLNDSAQQALELMIEHDFSQLPIINNDGQPLGMATSDSILRALNHFGVTLDVLRVSDAMIRAYDFREDEDLFELLEELKASYAVLIVDSEGRLSGIVTSYDSTEYFRRRAEDMMLVEDIESTLKDFVLAAFGDETGQTNQEALEMAIEEVTPSDRELRKRFQQALSHYLELQNSTSSQPTPEWIDNAFDKHLARKEQPKPFDKLTLYEFIEMFLHKSRWHLYDSILTLDPKAIRKLLDSVRVTRNDLAHFRAEITPKQRDELRFCKDWVSRHQSDIKQLFSPKARAVLSGAANSVENADEAHVPSATVFEEIVPIDEEQHSSSSRYAPLAHWLSSREHYFAHLKFKQIEEIIGGELPKFARKHRSWWANDSVAHVQSQQWLGAGWRVSSVDVFEEKVEFVRISNNRERAYIDFFSKLLGQLREADFPLNEKSPTVSNYFSIARLPQGGPAIAVIACSFVGGKKFRVELYIKHKLKDVNKQIFDAMYNHEATLESEMRHPLSWERMDANHASRIAAYHNGDITSDDEALEEVRHWAVSTAAHFYKVVGTKFVEVWKSMEDQQQAISKS